MEIAYRAITQDGVLQLVPVKAIIPKYAVGDMVNVAVPYGNGFTEELAKITTLDVMTDGTDLHAMYHVLFSGDESETIIDEHAIIGYLEAEVIQTYRRTHGL